MFRIKSMFVFAYNQIREKKKKKQPEYNTPQIQRRTQYL